MAASLTFHHLTHRWPDGTTALHDVQLSLGPGLHGLLGRNGSGKTTLLRLAAGDLAPTQGTVEASGAVVRSVQAPWRHSGAGSVAHALGIAPVRAALARVERGRVTQPDLDLLEATGGWDVEERAGTWLRRLGLGHLELDRALPDLSGGELSLLHVAAALLTEPQILLLDEPTNNLDDRGRGHLMRVLATFTGVVVVASHDRAFLESVDDIVEIHEGSVRLIGGGYTLYEELLATEREAAERSVRDAQQHLARERRELVETRIKLDRRLRDARRAEREKRVPKIVAHSRRQDAQVSAGRLRGRHLDDVAAARSRLDHAERARRDDREIAIDLPRTRVPRGRDVLVTEDLVLARVGRPFALHLRGPERVALTGPNGSGKTTALHTLLGRVAPEAGRVRLEVPAAMLSQRPAVPDESVGVAQNVAALAPAMPDEQIRLHLARLLFRADEADRAVHTLSGGERLRAALACTVLADPAPQLLVLDEPTNDLDLAAVAHLVQTLRGFEGALLVVSHDERFLSALELDRRIDVAGAPG